MKAWKRGFAVLLACGLALSLLPLAAQAETGDYFAQQLTMKWDQYIYLYPGVEPTPGGSLFPSEYDRDHYRLISARCGGQTAQAQYDSRGNLTEVTITDENSVRNTVERWEYDSRGQEIRYLVTETFTDGEAPETAVTDFTYDPQGRIVRETITRPEGETYSIHYTYDAQGLLVEERVESEGAPSVQQFFYQGDRLIRDVYEGDGVKAETVYTYDKNGFLTEDTSTRYDAVTGGYQKTESWTTCYAYDSAGRLTNRKSDDYLGDGTHTFADEYQWTFFQDGKLNRQLYAWENQSDGGTVDSRTCTIDYDNAGRISSVTSGDVVHTYTYDAAGNNTKVSVRGGDVQPYEITFTYGPIPATGFLDVAEDAYYAAAVAWAVAGDVTTGTSDTTFSPDRPCTRAQVVTFLWRAMGEQSARQTGTFTDVPAGSYYEKAVAWAVDNGVTQGTSAATFSPDRPCTRAQVVTFLHRAMGEPRAMHGTDLFTDVPAEAYYFQPVLWAVDNGVTQGTSANTFGPGRPCTRAQVVTFLYRALAG